MNIFPIDDHVDLDDIRKAKRDYLEKGYLEEGRVRPIVYEAWKRSRNYGIDPDLGFSAFKLLTPRQYRKKVEENSFLIEMAKPFMQALNLVLTRSHFCIYLFSKDGYPIYSAKNSSEEILSPDIVDILVRTSWAEEVMGASGFSLALENKAAVQIIGPEFWRNCFSNSCGSHAPILDGKGEPLGVIAIVVAKPRLHLHTLGMVVSCAAAIKNHIQHRTTLNDLELYVKKLHAAFNSLTDGFISIRPTGEIMEMNDAALEVLGIRGKDERGRHLDSIVVAKPTFSHLIDKAMDKKKITEDEVIHITNCSQEGVKCIASVSLITTDGSSPAGIVILLKNVKRIKGIANCLVSPPKVNLAEVAGVSKVISDLKAQVAMIAKTHANVIIQGETGTGKELFANLIHSMSPRADYPFVALNCSAIPIDLFESIMFGYEKGAFTGAKTEGHKGKFEMAEGGTLFLDEVGEMPFGCQTKLLRVLSEGKIERIGGQKPLAVNVRVITATNKVLEDEVRRGNFRRDLYYRFNVFTIKLPPLRERKEDILPLIERFITKRLPPYLKERVKMKPEFIAALDAYEWPGNIRELQNILERALTLSRDYVLDISCLPEYIIKTGEEKQNFGYPVNEIIPLAETEKRYIGEVLNRLEGNKSKAASLLGIGRNTLYRKIGKLND